MLNTSRSIGFKLARSVLQSGSRAASESFAAGSVPKGVGFQKLAYRSTTILCVRKDGQVVMAGDGQASQGPVVAKGNVKKVRRIGTDILVGFAGSTADAFSLLDKLEKQLEEHPGQLMRACVELAKLWRSDKYLRRLEAVLLVADANNSFEVTGNGDVLEPESGVLSIGSGSNFALAAATALIDQPHLSAEDIVRKSMKIAGDYCVYTNHNIIVEKLVPPPVTDAPAGEPALVTPAATTETAVSGAWNHVPPIAPSS